MQTLAKQILEQAAGVPEGTPLVAKELLYLSKLESQRALPPKKKGSQVTSRKALAPTPSNTAYQKQLFIGVYACLTQ